MNRIYIGTKRVVKLPKGSCFVIAKTMRNIPQKRRPTVRVFDPQRDSFNLIANLNYRKICDIVENIGAIFTGGENTLTRETGLEYLADALARGDAKTLEDLIPEPDKKSTTGHIWAHGKIQRMLRSPILKRVLCGQGKQFSFNPRSTIFARIDRTELGVFDATVLALFLMAEAKGQIVVPDFGPYARELHGQLLEESRLVAGINFLDELPPGLRRSVMGLPARDRVAAGALPDDADELAKHAGLRPDKLREDSEYARFVSEAMS